jgi:uncharacterized protein
MTNTVVVLDTVVFVRALLNAHGMWGEIVFRYSHTYHLVMSRYTTKELVGVLARPEFRLQAPHISDVDISTLLTLIAQAEFVETGPIKQISRDRKDNPFLALARAAGADYLVTEDKDLLVLHSYRGTQIVTGQELARILQEGGGKAA